MSSVRQSLADPAQSDTLLVDILRRINLYKSDKKHPLGEGILAHADLEDLLVTVEVPSAAELDDTLFLCVRDPDVDRSPVLAAWAISRAETPAPRPHRTRSGR